MAERGPYNAGPGSHPDARSEDSVGLGSVARAAFSSVAQLPAAAEIMGVHTAMRFDKAVCGRYSVAEHMLACSR